jgi:hypothetical protein
MKMKRREMLTACDHFEHRRLGTSLEIMLASTIATKLRQSSNRDLLDLFDPRLCKSIHRPRRGCACGETG